MIFLYAIRMVFALTEVIWFLLGKAVGGSSIQLKMPRFTNPCIQPIHFHPRAPMVHRTTSVPPPHGSLQAKSARNALEQGATSSSFHSNPSSAKLAQALH